MAPMLTAPKLRSPSLPLLHPRDPLALIVDLAERYCVVLQTVRSSPEITVSRS